MGEGGRGVRWWETEMEGGKLRRQQQRRAGIVLEKAPVEMILQPPAQDPWVQPCAESISRGARSQCSPGCTEVVFD